ncbi:putative phosphoprotein phosphatase [Leptomonas seymouri]|uniref:Putative phosphoprotein phosphatase n=1 Tax=Leptomonas seymouri TaxID=5684 RepID=A0A0N1PDS9_LEPSE|nr:putative phosphoprotein phosphatase [Leptomonas seymouri]|eukprot:KPI89641.1 putative phosphoprotein phosphatase [Leptomonas seymouri]
MPLHTLSAKRRQCASESAVRAPFHSPVSSQDDPFNEDSTPYTTYSTGAGSVAARQPTSPCASLTSVEGRSPDVNGLCGQAPSATASFIKRSTAWLPLRALVPPATSEIPVDGKRPKSDGGGIRADAPTAVLPLEAVGRLGSPGEVPTDARKATAAFRSSLATKSPTFSTIPCGFMPVSPRAETITTAVPHNPPAARPSSLSSTPAVPRYRRHTLQPLTTTVPRRNATASSTATSDSFPQRVVRVREPFPDAEPAALPMDRLSCGTDNNSGGRRYSTGAVEAAIGPLRFNCKPPVLSSNYARSAARLSAGSSLRTSECDAPALNVRPSALCWEAGASISAPGAAVREERTAKAARPPFFSAAAVDGNYVPLIDWLLHCGEVGDMTMQSTMLEDDKNKHSTFFNEDYITKLCAAATQVLCAEPTLLELEVHSADTLIVVGDIHGQFQDLYTSVLRQQYDRRRCNPGGLDRRFLFMGDYVDRGPHSLEVVLLLLALKVEYPTLIYLTRGNHEEEKTSRVYGFLTEVTSSLGPTAGAAVWSAVNKVFLDLPLAAIVRTPHMRFFVTHGGLSPCLHSVDEISTVSRNRYSAGDITADQDDMVTGLLWSDPTDDVSMYRRNPRGCGFMFGPTASRSFCIENGVDFICRAHQVAMDGYFWTHDDRVVTVFSAPNYCGINDNRGAVMLVNGHTRRPIMKQYDSVGTMAGAPDPRPVFPYSSMFS